jgi:proliferating cell nuclear antigen PCNA
MLFITDMNIVIKNQEKAELFAMFFQHIRLFSENINIMFEKNRMYIQTMDSSRVSIIEFILHSSWFDEYTHTGNSGICLGVNSTTLYKILNSRDKTQEILITYEDDDSDRLKLQFTSSTKNIFDKHFQLPLMEIDADLMEIPDFNSNAELTINSSNFSNIVNQLQLFGDSLDIDCSEEKILLNSESQETGKMSVEIKLDDVSSFSINEGSNLKLSFSLTYLHNICMYNKISKEIEIKLTENYPMKVIYNLSSEDSKIIFYLAPKVNDDEE